ncbi:MAG: 39S mitochondrial ribosomal protein L46-domain-containing protein, partial [Olpidium bornovanus]
MVRLARTAVAGLAGLLPAVARPCPSAAPAAAGATPASASRRGRFAGAGLSRRHYARALDVSRRKARGGSAPAAGVPGLPRVGASGDHIKAAVVLSRGPVVTRALTDFEQAYFAYRDALRLYNAAPFGTDFYFKKRTSAERRFLTDYDKRMKRAFQVAAAPNCEPEYSAPWQAAIDDATAEQLAKEDEEAARASQYVTEPRVTEADRMGDVKSLDRALESTLYLIVKKARKDHQWAFPQGAVESGEGLVEVMKSAWRPALNGGWPEIQEGLLVRSPSYCFQAAERELVEECGNFMDSWFVGRVPMGHYAYTYPPDFVEDSAQRAKGAKVR